MRNWKLLTGVSTVSVSFHLVFRERYENLNGREHVFSGVQRWYNAKVDSLLGVEGVVVGGRADGTTAAERMETEAPGGRTKNISAPAAGVFKKESP